MARILVTPNNINTPKSAYFQVLREFSTVYEQVVTPEQARFILQNHNVQNRPLKESSVAGYARDMQLGKWQTRNGEFIKFDSNGQLISGQHRLQAVIRAGIPVALDFMFGLKPQTRETIDTGVTRTPADVLRLTTGDANSAFRVVICNGIKKLLNRHRDRSTLGLIQALSTDFSRGIEVVLKMIQRKNAFGRGPAAGAIAMAAEAYPRKVMTVLERILGSNAESDAERALARYAFSNFGNDREDDIADKVLYGLYVALEHPEQKVERLQTKSHDEVLSFFMDQIQRNHACPSLNLLVPQA